MKRFIIISVLAALTLPMLACGWVETDNYYLYRIYKPNNFRENADKVCTDNWKAYLGITEGSFWFDADQVTAAAKKKGDALMVTYVENLMKYLKCVGVERRKLYEWNYPTKEEVNKAAATLQAVRNYALSKTQSRLRSQHALLFMRCNMMLGRHDGNISYWENNGSKLPKTIYKEMMKNIYAGALYKTGRVDEAGEIFAEMGDYESLMTIYYEKRSFEAIRAEYLKNPNAKALPFLLQDFVNNTQEARDAEGKSETGGKLFIRAISRTESAKMQDFCEKVVAEGKTDAPIMWKAAKAWMAFMDGKQKEAARDILAATGMAGTDRMKECARELMLFITASQATAGEAFDDYLADELSWLKERRKNNDEYVYSVLRRLGRQVLFQHYAGSPGRVAAMMDFVQSDDMNYVDTTSVANAERYLRYRLTPAANKLDKLLKAEPLAPQRQTALEELIGTKYMRLCQWDKAAVWLKNIPLSYYNESCSTGFRYYSVMRSYNVELWLKRQWLNESEAYSKELKWRENLKLKFCQEMQALETGLNLLQGKALEQRYYKLAVRYAQASQRGDCWWLLHNWKSLYYAPVPHEADMAAKTVELLRKASATSDESLKIKALFALGWQELYPNAQLWRRQEWNPEKGDFYYEYQSDSPQFMAYRQLFDIVEDAPEEPEYVTKCDAFLQFRKYARRNLQ